MALDSFEQKIVDENPAMKATFDLLTKINEPHKWLYGSELRDRMLLQNPATLSRYGHLARKALFHYAGENYNPHTISIMSEVHIRTLIQWTIEYKVQGRCKGYDWELIDNFFMKVVYGELDLTLPSDFKKIDREVLPEFRSPYHGLDTEVAN